MSTEEMSAEESSYGGELAVGQTWNLRFEGGQTRTLRATKRSFTNGTVRYWMTESGTDFGRWLDAAWIVTHGERCR